MVSGFVTSPYDHPRICSGDARLIRIALKSFTSNNVPSEWSLGSAGRPPPVNRSSCPQLPVLVAFFESGNVHIETRDLIQPCLIGEVNFFFILVEHLD